VVSPESTKVDFSIQLNQKINFLPVSTNFVSTSMKRPKQDGVIKNNCGQSVMQTI